MNMLVRLGDHPRFIRATPHQADQVARFGGGELVIDDRPRFSGQARMEWARERCLLNVEMMLAAHRAAPKLYAYLGEI